MKDAVILGLLGMCLAGIAYSIYLQRIMYPAHIRNCFETATNLEQLRHDTTPNMGVEVTTFDVAQYMKNMDACLADI